MLTDEHLTNLCEEMTSRYVHLAAEQAVTIEQRVTPMEEIDIKPMRPRRR